MVNVPNTDKSAQVIITSLAHKNVKNKNIQISFFPYDFEFDDSYKPEWGTYEGFGRMDPIMTYKRTTREVNLSFNVVAENSKMAKINFINLQTFIKCLYPDYKSVDLSTTAQALQERRDKLLPQIEEKRAAQQLEETQRLNEGEPQQSLIEDELFQEGEAIDNEPLRMEAQQAETLLTQEIQTISDFGVNVINKSPLFQISFMNLLNKQQFVAAITSFKHKMKFDAADTSFSNGQAIPGEFSINISFKVLHTDIPGNRLNYGF
jgi:hypothetical protein